MVGRRVFGAFEYRITVAPGARESLRLAVVFHKDGTEQSRPVSSGCSTTSARCTTRSATSRAASPTRDS